MRSFIQAEVPNNATVNDLAGFVVKGLFMGHLKPVIPFRVGGDGKADG